QVTMASGRDTTLQGAQVSGEKVKAEVGRNLTLASEQDSDRYDSKQQSASAGGSFTFGSMTGSASVNASRDRMHSTWQSVEEQTGIFAGRGGFDVSVGAHTQLDGAVIGSTAAADKNRLETGTLGFSDIENHADYKVEHQSAGISTGGSIAGQFAGNMANGLLVGANHSGSDSSTTKAAVSEGAIVIRDRDNQTQDVSGLSRDVEHANQTLSPIFDKEREQNRLQEAQLIGEIGNQAADIARTEGQIAGEKAKRDPAALQAAKEALAGKGNLNPTADQIAEEAYNTAMAPFGTGSALQKGMQAATAAVQGLAGGVAGDGTADVVAGAQAGRNAVENNQLHEDEARQLEKEMLDCKKTGGDCSKAAEKYIEISNKNSQELKATCTGGGITCVTWEELIQADTNVARDENPSQFRLSEKLKDPSAAALVNYLNGADLKFLKDNISSGDRVMAVVMDPTSWPTIVMGGRAILTNAVNNTKEQLIAVGVGAGLGAGIQYGTTGEVKLSDMIGTSLIGAITAGKGYNPTMAWNAAGGYYQAEISGDDPFMAALLSKAGASAGYAAGNVIKVPMDKIFNPTSKQYEWVPTGVWTITKPVPQSQIPSIMGNLGDTYVSGATGDVLNKTLSGGKNEEK
ncbi:MAG: hemagglutinin repeat-containing protein, partial [Pantoea sp.]|nr:hemagglutinin repeat-containing protein [Pantoea sp.]